MIPSAVSQIAVDSLDPKDICKWSPCVKSDPSTRPTFDLSCLSCTHLSVPMMPSSLCGQGNLSGRRNVLQAAFLPEEQIKTCQTDVSISKGSAESDYVG